MATNRRSEFEVFLAITTDCLFPNTETALKALL
jgi:hypothetical protein